MSQTLRTHVADRVLTVVNDDPPSRNALTPAFYTRCRDVLDAAASDDAVGAVVLTGAGGFFCAGANVKGLKERSEADPAARRANVDRLHALIRAVRACPKPVIAAVEGGAAGAGVALALAADLVVAADDAYFSVAHVRIGVTPDGGTTAFLREALPRQLVNEMVWTGDRIAAERLRQFGLVNRMVLPGEALAVAQSWARSLAAGPAATLAAGKDLIESAGRLDLDAQLDREAEAIANALGGAEAREGIAAFLDKRAPHWPAQGSQTEDARSDPHGAGP